MNITELAKAFFTVIDERIGPFDRPFNFHVFPFDAGGALNFMTTGKARGEKFVTYVSWDLFGHERQKRGALGRYELITACDDEDWCLKVLTKIGEQSLQEVIEPGDTLDIGPWVGPNSPLQGVIFEEAFRTELETFPQREPCGLLRCVGVTRAELEFAVKHGAEALVERLKHAGVYPRTVVQRNETVKLED